MEVQHMAALVAAGLVAAALVKYISGLMQSRPKAVETEIKSGAKKDAEKTKKKAKLAKTGGCGTDIEDLVGQSLIPITLKSMKAEGVKPYTKADRAEKVNELEATEYPSFLSTLSKNKVSLKRQQTTVFQMNIGFYCNQACAHCHVDSSPLRKDMMSRATADKCLSIIRNTKTIEIVDLTGGAPELCREFRYLVEECSKMGLQMIDRCNLTVLLEPRMEDLPAFLAKHKVRVIASLPCYLESNLESQRGDQVFRRSIKALQMLNKVGYGTGSDLHLDLVYNPTGIHLPPAREKLEKDYKRVLKTDYDITFDQLHCITNMPINRFYDHLKGEGKLAQYMQLLVDNFNPSACAGVMCTTYVSVDPHGNVFDCDFNQQLDLPIKIDKKPVTVFDIDTCDDLLKAAIQTKKHCFGCTAGSGSS